jgi:hypothetical protein
MGHPPRTLELVKQSSTEQLPGVPITWGATVEDLAQAPATALGLAGFFDDEESEA